MSGGQSFGPASSATAIGDGVVSVYQRGWPVNDTTLSYSSIAVEATKVTVTHDDWAEDDPTYAACADGWPRILSRLKTLLETGKTFKPH